MVNKTQQIGFQVPGYGVAGPEFWIFILDFVQNYQIFKVFSAKVDLWVLIGSTK